MVLDERIDSFQGSPAIRLLGDVIAIAGGTGEVFVNRAFGLATTAFAGEAETEVERACAIAIGDPPEATVACMVEALKAGDRDARRPVCRRWRFIPADEEAAAIPIRLPPAAGALRGRVAGFAV